MEDLLVALVKVGTKVAYLNTGAESKWPRTCIGRRKDLPCLAWNLSSKLSYTQYWSGTRQPLSQITADRDYRRTFLSIVTEFRPDLVHFHELTSFPIGLLDELRNRSIKTVFSAADFYVLCPTVKLLRPDLSFCDKTPEQLDCHICSQNARCARALQWNHANDHWLNRFLRVRNLGRRLIRTVEKLFCKPNRQEQYIERRQNFERIFRNVDVVLTTSRAQERIFKERTTGWNIRFLQRSRSTIRTKTPDPRLGTRSPDKLVFVALNIVNPAKGLSLLEEAFSAIHEDHPEIELHIYGLSDGNAPGVKYFGPYDDSQLDSIVDSADFGILPSIWPEAFGYVGPEMLSRGLPVLASNLGAMPDYVMHKTNGLLFDPGTPGALEGSLRQLVEDANLRKKLWHGAARGERRYLDMDQHVAKLLNIYGEILTANPKPVPEAV